MHLSNVFKKSACAVVSTALLSCSLLLSGCSTPKVAATVEGVKYSSADYFAYLFNAYQEVFYTKGLSQYAQYGVSPWTQKLPYGEGDNAEQLSVEDYIKREAKDNMIRQVEIKKMMDQYGITVSDSEKSNADSSISSLPKDYFIKMGFNNDTYKNMYFAVTLNESALFYGLYDNNGPRKMSEDEISKYYSDNILTYKIIETSLVDSATGADLSEDKVKEAKANLQKYLDIYKANGNFDAAVTQYTNDQQAAAAASTTGGTDTTTTAATTTTTAATTTSTTTSTTAASGTTTTAATNKSSDSANTEDANLRYADANTYGDEDFTNAVKSVSIGDAKIVQYKKNGTTNTAALILRINPETTKYKLSEARKNVIYGAKYKEFDAEVKKNAAELKNDFSNSIIKKTSVKDMVDKAPTAKS